MTYKTLQEILLDIATSIRSPERLSVGEAAEKYRQLKNAGSYVGKWKNSTTPYLVEPMDVLTMEEYQGMIFVGPAQSGKTDMFSNWLCHTAICNPMDMVLVQITKSMANDFMERRIKRLVRDNPDLRKRVVPGRHNQTLTRLRFKSGMILSMSYPAISELSSKSIPYLWLTDYDRMPEDIDGEGNAYDLAKTRARSFRQYGMTVAESSPGFNIEDIRWMPKTKHEAPPTGGILALYNRGDKRRWYWQCPACNEYFEPTFELLTWTDLADMNDAASSVRMECPHCAHGITHDGDEEKGIPGKHKLNQTGLWLKDGQTIDKEGNLRGEPAQSEIASFWMMGVVATFSDWRGLLLNYLRAMEEYETKGLEESLKTTINVDQGMPYRPRALELERLPESLKDRAKDLGHKQVPHGVRFLVANIDVQSGRFVVQVHGIGEKGDMYIIDRFDIKDSVRIAADGKPDRIKPGAYLEDWKLIIPNVLEKTYPLIDGSGRAMRIKVTTVDSAGEMGVTKNAYDFYRYLKYKHTDNLSLHRRFMLTKGGSSKNAPRTAIVYPDTQKKDRFAEAKGEIPVMLINTHEIKNSMSKFLGREEPGGYYVNFPNWLPDWFYEELTSERLGKKGWEMVSKKKRNEAWDLLCYCHAICINVQTISIERINWDNPPSWAKGWEDNPLVFFLDESKGVAKIENKKYTMKELAERMS